MFATNRQKQKMAILIPDSIDSNVIMTKLSSIGINCTRARTVPLTRSNVSNNYLCTLSNVCNNLSFLWTPKIHITCYHSLL